MLKRAEELSPDHPNIYTNMGKIYLKFKDYKRAEEAFQNSIQISPFDPKSISVWPQLWRCREIRREVRRRRKSGKKLRR